MNRAILVSLMLGAVATYALPALAQDPNEKAIKARRGLMQAISFYAGPLFGMAKGKVAYDAKKAQMFADNLKAVALVNSGPMWVKGTDAGAYKGKTRAKAEMWAADSKVGDASKAFTAAASDLATAAGGGLDGLKAKVAALGKSCGGCHKPYRNKEF